MKKLILIILILMLSSTSLGATYYYMMDTNMTNNASDPVRQFTDKYSKEGKVNVFFGKNLAIVVVDVESKPTNTGLAVVNMTEQNVKDITAIELKNYGFDASKFITTEVR